MNLEASFPYADEFVRDSRYVRGTHGWHSDGIAGRY